MLFSKLAFFDSPILNYIFLQYPSSNHGQMSNMFISGTNANLANDGLNDSPHDSNPMTGVTLQISNLDTTIEENDLKQYLINRLKPIATVLSIYFETLSVAKIKLPTDHQARQVITYLHRKKIGHKRITVSIFIYLLCFFSYLISFWIGLLHT